MGGHTPSKTKEKVLRHHLSGLGRKKTADKVGIGEGTVQSIIKEIRESEVPDVDLLRAVAIQVRKKGWDLNVFASAVRQRNMLHSMAISDDKIDSLIENIHEHCFKQGITLESFIDRVENISLTSHIYNCPIDKLDELKAQKEAQIFEAQYQLNNMQDARAEALQTHSLTEQDIAEFKQDRPLIETIRTQRQELQELNQELELSRATVILERADAATREALANNLTVIHVPDNMTSKDVVRAAQLMARNAHVLSKEIKSILDRAPSLPYHEHGPNPDFKDLDTHMEPK